MQPKEAASSLPADDAGWDSCVHMLLGPLLIGESEQARQRQALELAAAALRAAGEHVLAENLLDE